MSGVFPLFPFQYTECCGSSLYPFLVWCMSVHVVMSLFLIFIKLAIFLHLLDSLLSSLEFISPVQCASFIVLEQHFFICKSPGRSISMIKSPYLKVFPLQQDILPLNVTNPEGCKIYKISFVTHETNTRCF